MKQDVVQQIIKSNDVLLETNSRLANNNSQAINLAQLGIKQREKLLSICLEIYQGLSDIEKRSVAEESWYKGLHKALRTQ